MWLQTHRAHSPGFSQTRQAPDGGAFHTLSERTRELEQVHHLCVPGAGGSGLRGQLDSLVVVRVSTRQPVFYHYHFFLRLL